MAKGKLAAVLALMFVASAGHTGEWCAGVIHLHTIYSDGESTPTELRDLVRPALDVYSECPHTFMMVTDHFELLDAHRRQAHQPNSSYRPTIQALSEPGKFLAMPCVELATAWQPVGQDITANSHLLALGIMPASYTGFAEEYLQHPLTLELLPHHQLDMIAAVRRMGMLPVAAHPSQYARVELHVSSHLLTVSDYRFDERFPNLTGLAGVEVWNEVISSQSEEDIAFYLRVVASGMPVCVTTGADFHGLGILPLPFTSKSELLRCLQRFTWVYANSFDEAGIQAGMAAGRTYASRNGARFDLLTPGPGEHAMAQQATISAKVSLHGDPRKAPQPREFLVYRDGVLVEGSRKPWTCNARACSYEWTDPDAQSGEEHSYVLRVGEYLITSPIYIRVP